MQAGVGHGAWAVGEVLGENVAGLVCISIFAFFAQRDIFKPHFWGMKNYK